MDITAVPLKLENDFPRNLEVRTTKQINMMYKGELRTVLEIDTFILPRFGVVSYKTFVFPIKVDLECLVIDYKDYEKACAEILEYVE